MDNTKFTEGKWEYNVENKGSTKNALIKVIIPNHNTIKVGEICRHDDCLSPICCKTELHANALLISKAPEMLEMLNNLYNDLKQGAMPTHEEINSIQHLIKEATELN